MFENYQKIINFSPGDNSKLSLSLLASKKSSIRWRQIFMRIKYGTKIFQMKQD
jgi:hypothetical protein